MKRRNNDLFYGPPSSSNQYGPERIATSSAYIDSTRNPAAFITQERNSNANLTEKGALYDPYDVASDDSEAEGREDHTVNHRSGPRSQYEGQARHNDDFGTRNSAYSMLDSQPDQLSHGLPAQPMATPEAMQFLLNAFEENKTIRLEGSALAASDKELASPSLRITPPTLQVDYQHQSGFGGTAVDQIKATTDVSRKRSRSPFHEVIRGHFTCELCWVELSDGKAFKDHLESSSHWDTLEHAQLQNKYDDMTVAFIQESMLQQLRGTGNLAMDDDDVNEFCKTDHITKVEMYRCAVCRIYIPMSKSSIQHHLKTPRHIVDKVEFSWKQKQSAPGKARDLIRKYEPEYIQFLEGKDPFV